MKQYECVRGRKQPSMYSIFDVVSETCKMHNRDFGTATGISKRKGITYCVFWTLSELRYFVIFTSNGENMQKQLRVVSVIKGMASRVWIIENLRFYAKVIFF